MTIKANFKQLPETLSHLDLLMLGSSFVLLHLTQSILSYYES